MATYNGAAFLGAQLKSIMSQLEPQDELIVVDDGSVDDSMQIIQQLGDDRIRLDRNVRRAGVVRSFEIALRRASREIVILADQDDVWIPGRVERMVWELVTSDQWILSSNAEYMDADERAIDWPMPVLRASDSDRHVRNIWRIVLGRAGYYGCAMAFRRSAMELILPIPSYVESHDLWIALAGNLHRSMVHLEAPTLRRRIHGGNASVVKRSTLRQLWSRVVFVMSVCHLSLRVARRRREAGAR